MSKKISNLQNDYEHSVKSDRKRRNASPMGDSNQDIDQFIETGKAIKIRKNIKTEPGTVKANRSKILKDDVNISKNSVVINDIMISQDEPFDADNTQELHEAGPIYNSAKATLESPKFAQDASQNDNLILNHPGINPQNVNDNFANYVSSPINENSLFLQAFVQSVQNEQMQANKQLLYSQNKITQSGSFSIQGNSNLKQSKKCFTAMTGPVASTYQKINNLRSNQDRKLIAGHFRVKSASCINQPVPQAPPSVLNRATSEYNQSKKVIIKNIGQRGLSISAQSKYSTNIGSEVLPYHERMTHNANKKMNQLNALLTYNETHKNKKKSFAVNKNSLDSKFTTHTNKRDENIQRQNDIRRKQQNEMLQRVKEATDALAPRMINSKLISPQKNRQLIQRMSDISQERPGSVMKDYDYHKANILLNEAKSQHQIYQDQVYQTESVLTTNCQYQGDKILDASQSDVEIKYDQKIGIMHPGSDHGSREMDEGDKQFRISLQNTGKHNMEKAKDNYIKQVGEEDVTNTSQQFSVFRKAVDANTKDKTIIELQSPLKVQTEGNNDIVRSSGVLVSTNPRTSALKEYDSNEVLKFAKNELSLNRRRTSVISSQFQGSPKVIKMQQESLKKVGLMHVEENDAQIKGIDPKYSYDLENYKPNMDFSVTLNFKKEFIRHKRIMCSLREFSNFEIQNIWDVSYCKTFCNYGNNSQFGIGVDEAGRDHSELLNHPQKQTEFEQDVRDGSKYYIENYRKEAELKDVVGKIVLQQMETKNEYYKEYLQSQGTLFNTATRQLMEGYLQNPEQKYNGGVGYNDFEDKMVLRFKNENEIGLYFEAVDQLCNVVILKGQNVLFEKEHYQDLIKNFIDLNKEFLMYLCKDEAYGGIKDVIDQNQSVLEKMDDEDINTNVDKSDIEVQLKQKMRFKQRDNEHRSFTRAFLFDYIFKTFIQILDACLSQRDKMLEEKKEEWQYLADKKCNHLENEYVAIQKQMIKLEVKQELERQNYESRIQTLKEEQQLFRDHIEDYKEEIYRLKDFDCRHDTVAHLQKTVREANNFIDDAEIELQLQRKMIMPVLANIKKVADVPKFKECQVQTDCQIGCYKANILTQIDSNDLQEYAESSLNRLSSVVQQLRNKQMVDQALKKGKDDVILERDEFIVQAKQKKNLQKLTGKNKKEKTVQISDDPTDVLLRSIDEKPLDKDDAINQLTDYMNQMCANNQPYVHFNDFLCSRIISEQPEVIKSAVQLEKLINCMNKHKEHPIIDQYSQIMGLNGYKRMDHTVLTYYMELRESMIREAGAQLGDSIQFQNGIQFVKKNFKNNVGLIQRVFSNLYKHLTKEKLDILGLSALTEVVTKKEFSFEKGWTDFKKKHFFDVQNEEYEGTYLLQLNFAIYNLVSQLKLQNKELSDVFCEPKEEGKERQLLKLRQSAFNDILKQNNILLGKDDLKLILTFLDPSGLVQDDTVNWSYDTTNLLKIQDAMQVQSITKAKVGQSLLINCIYQQIKEFITIDIPFSIEQSARQILGVTSIGVNSREAILAKEQLKSGIKPTVIKKKGEKPPPEINYNIDYNVFTKCVDQINITGEVKSTNTKFTEELKLIAQNTVNPAASSPMLGQKKQGLNNSPNKVLDSHNDKCDYYQCSNLFIRLASQTDVLQVSLSKELNNSDTRFMYLGQRYVSQYGNDHQVKKIQDMVKSHFKIFQKKEKIDKKQGKTDKNLGTNETVKEVDEILNDN